MAGRLHLVLQPAPLLARTRSVELEEIPKLKEHLPNITLAHVQTRLVDFKREGMTTQKPVYGGPQRLTG